ncbi:Kunitz/Bovine pancreatic trypsin inhibitor domain protein [Cooperia oncophora]
MAIRIISLQDKNAKVIVESEVHKSLQFLAHSNFSEKLAIEPKCLTQNCGNAIRFKVAAMVGVPLRDSLRIYRRAREFRGCSVTHECYAVARLTNGIPSLLPYQILHLRTSAATRIFAVLRRCLQCNSILLQQIVTKKVLFLFCFNGCDGNPNNFASLNQCNNFCTASGSVSFEESSKVRENSHLPSSRKHGDDRVITGAFGTYPFGSKILKISEY